MKKNHLREIVGDKIRWQYFTWPLLILLLSTMIFLSFVLFFLLPVYMRQAAQCYKKILLFYSTRCRATNSAKKPFFSSSSS